MKIVVWGIGVRGKRLYSILPEKSIVAYIDKNINYIGKEFNGIPIIGFDTYLNDYMDYPILISPLNCGEIVRRLYEKKITDYWILYEEPMDMYSQNGRPLMELFKDMYFNNKSYIIAGNSLYMILLYEYLKKQKYWVKIIDYRTNVGNRYIYEKYRCDLVVFVEDLLYEYEVLLYDDSFFCKYIFEAVGTIEYVDMTDTLFKTKKYYNGNLHVFKNKHKNKRCFLVGNGPSLKMKDLQKLHIDKEYSFGVNAIYKSANMTNWRPTYYVAADTQAADLAYEEILKYDVSDKFIRDAAKVFWNHILPTNIYKCHTKYYYESAFLKNKNRFSEDICYGMYTSGTVMHVCMQLAVYMGFKEIVIIGVDNFRYKKESSNHFIENYIDEKIEKLLETVALDVDRVTLGYKYIKKYADEHGIKIYNATRGGELEVFERINFDDLF